MRLLPLFAAALVVNACVPEPAVEPPTPTPVPGPENPWNPGPYGEGVMDVSDDWDFPTEQGEWDFQDNWTGQDSYVFVQRQSHAYSDALWGGDWADVLEESPRNVHWFFASRRYDWQADMAEMQGRLDGVLDDMDDEDADHWRPRLHVASEEVNELGGAVERAYESDWGGWGFAIDRFQRFRELGLLQFVGDGATGDPWFLIHPARHHNFEYEREMSLRAAPPDLEIELWDEFQMEGDRADAIIDLPDVSAFDTLEVDLTMGCVDHLDANCFEWDYKAWMLICGTEVDATTLPASCDPGEVDGEGNVVTPPETLACNCNSGYEGATTAERTCSPITDETGAWVGGEYLGDCPCGCDYSIARWITPYHREGRWVTDISPMLGWMQHSGPTRIHIDLDYPFVVSSSLRFSDRGVGTTPFAAERTWGGGSFNADYNPGHEPITFTPPDGTTRVQVVALITGHGFGGDAQNCSEFCPHAHHFQLNGGAWHTREFDEANSQLGCADQVAQGALPNQFGTWYFGRGGWCPGMDVAPVVFDLTDDLLPGQENTLVYRASLNGNEPANHGSIWMDSYLVYYR